MGKVNAVIDAALFYLLSAGLAALVLICFAQVVARYIFAASFTWAEEVSIIILLWTTWLGASLAVKQNAHLRVQILDDRLKPATKALLHLILSGLAIAFLLVIAWTSRIVIASSAFMSLFSMPNIPRNVLNYSVTFGCILMSYYIVRSMAGDWRNFQAERGTKWN
jgi:TRAP-type C4-dicarboxylate transport system permease small subunit